VDAVDDEERCAADGAEECKTGDGPEDEGEVEIVGDFAVRVCFADGHGEHGVADQPDDDHVCADCAVVIFLLLGLANGWFGDFDAVAEIAQGFVVAGVDIELLRRHFELDDVLRLAFRVAKICFRDVVALRTPRDVVRVTKGVNLERCDV